MSNFSLLITCSLSDLASTVLPSTSIVSELNEQSKKMDYNIKTFQLSLLNPPYHSNPDWHTNNYKNKTGKSLLSLRGVERLEKHVRSERKPNLFWFPGFGKGTSNHSPMKGETVNVRMILL